MFFEAVCKETNLLVENWHALYYTVVAEKLDRSHSYNMLGEMSCVLSFEPLNDWICFFFFFPSSISYFFSTCLFRAERKCEPFYYNTAVIWTPWKIQAASLHVSNIVQKDKGLCTCMPYCYTESTSITLKINKFKNNYLRICVHKPRPCISQGFTDRIICRI